MMIIIHLKQSNIHNTFTRIIVMMLEKNIDQNGMKLKDLLLVKEMVVEIICKKAVLVIQYIGHILLLVEFGWQLVFYFVWYFFMVVLLVQIFALQFGVMTQIIIQNIVHGITQDIMLI